MGNKVSYFFTVFFTFAGAKTLAGGRWTVPLTAISLMRSFFRIVSGATSPDLCKPRGRCGCDLMRGAREGPAIGIQPFSKNDTTILICLTRVVARPPILIGGENGRDNCVRSWNARVPTRTRMNAEVHWNFPHSQFSKLWKSYDINVILYVS